MVSQRDTGSWSGESIGFEDQTGTKGVQISYGQVPSASTAYSIPPNCHVGAGEGVYPTCCTSQICQCEGTDCMVDTSFGYAWVDIIDNGAGTQITTWENNGDDGWFHVDLPFDFNWFGTVENRVTIGTNGALTFGDAQLPYGDSEPVPCQWNGGGQGAGQAGCVQNGDAAAANTGGHYGVEVDGIIAVFWCDLNPDAAGGAGEGVYYQIIEEDTTQRFLMIYDQLIVTYNIPVFGTTNYCQFQTILRGEGDVIMQYKDMPQVTGSWSDESIGFEDATGTMGAQILYGAVPAAETAYYIPNTCHVLEGETSGCCNTKFCSCEGNLECLVETDFGYSWEDIIDNGRGTQITVWENNPDDGWFHLDLPFDFNWYGIAETTITIGTNGMLGFGQELLPYGDSEPVPCQWNGGAQGAGRGGCVGYDPDAPDAAATGGHYGVEIDGIIAPFWADLNPGDATGACATQNCGVYYYVAPSADISLAAFNKVIIEYRAMVWQAGGAHEYDPVPCHFEVILFGDGTVVFQYSDMPATSGSWSKESIGFEDRSGTQGVQISYGEVPVAGTAYQIPPMCHVEAGLAPAESCCTSIACQCEEVDCEVVTDFPYDWVDITGSGRRITDWEQNGDDGWKHVDLSWDFHWFGLVERRITIGTNGVMTFGSGQLGNGASEPVPCAWVGGGAIQGGQQVDGCMGVDYGSSGTNNGDSPDGVIAPFWADLTTDGPNAEGVYYSLIESPDARMLAFNKLIVEWNIPVWNGAETPCHFEVVLSGDGSVLFQYNSMPVGDSGSWSTESIGIEDQTGGKGIQISYGEIPRGSTAYYIPPSCHVAGGEDARSCTGVAADPSMTCDLDAETDHDANCPAGCTEVDLDSTATCCTSQVCQCESVPTCSIQTDTEFDGLYSDLSGASTADYHCPNVVDGDGIGGREVYFDQVVRSPEACIALVREQQPDANGATFGAEWNACYAEFGMTDKVDYAGWQTCAFPEPLGTHIGQSDWINNADDGWFHVDLPFDFNWFGTMERTITIGTNGVLTFGDAQLPYGDSEPVPCQWNGGGQGAGSAGCVQNGGGEAGGHYGVDSIEGIIAVFWCDLNPAAAAVDPTEGVYYQIAPNPPNADQRLAAFNKLTVEYQVQVFGNADALCHFEAILMGDGSVLMQYLDMPQVTGSWSDESIGFEDRSGSQGAQLLYGSVPGSGTAYYIPPACHTAGGAVEMEGCCTDQICECEGLNEDLCVVETDYPYGWVDIIDNGLGTQITAWENNGDDGWFHVDLPFDFNWFGTVENRVTIGTNGALTFGDAQLPYGDSEPVPCQWNGGGQGAGQAGCVQNGDAAAANTGGHYGVEVDGIIAVFWCDLNPDAAGGAGEGVYYQIIEEDTTQRFLMIYDQLIVTYNIPVFGTTNYCQFQTILRGEGDVIMQYKDMPQVTGSWSDESIGFEDATGTMGAQILYGAVPAAETAYYIPNTCHVLEGETSGCCNTKFCSCEGNLECLVETDFGYSWEDIIDNGRGTQITVWENNPDDGWFHLDLPFDFNWYGIAETTITIGTNGMLGFGQELLPYGDSEPVPCQWNGGAQGAGRGGCVGYDPDAPDAAATGGHYGVEIDGIIAPFWADLNPGDATGACATQNCGVYYYVAPSADISLAAFNKVIIEYRAMVWQAGGAHEYDPVPCHFEVILFGDGTVVFQYSDMPATSGSWSKESIGFEDRSGTQGVQISYGEVPVAGTAYQIPPMCHVEAGLAPAESCCTSIACQCEEVDCEVVTDFPYDWVDITGSGRRITDWEQNGDDGWKHVDLSWDFHWFGLVERRITIGTNGVMTFGSGQLGNGASEPVPCAWVGGGAIQGGQQVDGCMGVDYGSSGTNNGDSPDGVIAPFWADLTTDGPNAEGVYYSLIESPDARMLAFNKLIVEWNIPVWNGAETPCHFEVVLSGDGSVLFQYNSMPVGDSGSWSTESIGIEDQTGGKGIQISYGEIPRGSTAYYIPPSCHVAGGEDARSCTGVAADPSMTCDLDAETDHDANCPAGCTEVDLDSTATCCTSQVCQCESVPTCSIQTDTEFDGLYSDLSGASTADYHCPNVVDGDGIGGREVYFDQVVRSPEACIALVREQQPDANGATFGAEWNACYAEFGMTDKVDYAGWQTCAFPEPLGTHIGQSDWINNADDGWFHVDLPFDFNWFGTMERTITIGTNGVLTFGDAQLPYGDSEPVPCQWNGGGQGAGSAGCVQNGGGEAGGHYGVDSIEGIIAVFWCDLNPDVATDGQGVYYNVVTTTNPLVTAWNKFIVQWIVPVFGTTNLCHFEAILSGDGTVQLLYVDMPAESGSWARESIGFEDQTGTQGAQILYGVVPDTSDGPVAYTIPAQCHAALGEDVETCCSTQICQCEGVSCVVDTDAEYAWVEIIDSRLGTRIETWENNGDDGWFHVQLPFDFNWFGTMETTITIGTNGAITFGTDQLPYGDSEPVPCQ